jgi:hypothetical protein
MNYNVMEQMNGGTATPTQMGFPSRETLTVEELSQAVGKHALLQVEVDKKIALHIVAMREELRSTKNEVESLRAQMDQLIRGLTLAVDSARAHQNRASQTSSAVQSPMTVRSK